jgi:CRISPR-associated protein Cpf1
MDTFVRKYSLSKTLRFELKPVGETAEKIKDFKNQAIAEIVKQDRLFF